MGVIVQLAESCAESEERQDELMQCLLKVGQPNAQRGEDRRFAFLTIQFFYDFLDVNST